MKDAHLRGILADVVAHLADSELARAVGQHGAHDVVGRPVAEGPVARGSRDISEQGLAVGQEGRVAQGVVDDDRRPAVVLRSIGRLEGGLGTTAGGIIRGSCHELSWIEIRGWRWQYVHGTCSSRH